MPGSRSPRGATAALLVALSLLLTLLPTTASAQDSPDVDTDGPKRPLVYGGFDASNPGFLAYLEADLGGGLTASCTGSLIDPLWILTAAHCVEDARGISVWVGTDDRRLGVFRSAGAWYEHPAYDPNAPFGSASRIDLALVRLTSPVTGLGLARLNTDTSWPRLGQPLALAGWGTVDPFSAAPFLLQAGITEATSGVDGSYYSTCDPPWSSRDFFCFGGLTAVNACPGDSGGPLFSWDDPIAATGEVDTIYGVVSYGDTYACSSLSRDSVAAGVAPHLAWVSRVTGLSFGNRFLDVGDDNIFKADIEWLADKGITKGCNPPANTLFCPDDEITREQFAAFWVRALSLTANDGTTFTDVPPSNIFYTDIQRLATAGITKGCNPPTNTQFCPKDKVTREQFAAFAVRALGLTANDGRSFTDVPASNIFRTDIQRLATAGITKGCNPPANTQFCPKDNVTREQFAAFARRALEPILGP